MEKNHKDYMNNLRQAAANSAVSEELRLRRIALGLQQQQVALAAGIDQGNLCKYEKGVYHPSPAMFDKLLAAIDRCVRGKHGS